MRHEAIPERARWGDGGTHSCSEGVKGVGKPVPRKVCGGGGLKENKNTKSSMARRGYDAIPGGGKHGVWGGMEREAK
jgi:hypothetical protein